MKTEVKKILTFLIILSLLSAIASALAKYISGKIKLAFIFLGGII